MRILFVADGRSPIALNWINYFLEKQYQVHLASTYPCAPDARLSSLNVVPVAFSNFISAPRADNPEGGKRATSVVGVESISGFKKQLFGGSAVLGLRTLVRQWFGLLTLGAAAKSLTRIIAAVKPDLVHAMRIPYEGILAARADPEMPLLISVWGNDFTLHAPSTPWLRHHTKGALERADALHTDCQRDARLALSWGFSPQKPLRVLPGAGGVQLDVFRPSDNLDANIQAGNTLVSPLVINPRGFRAYVDNRAFFSAIPLVLKELPGARFLCPAMADEPQVQRWVIELGITGEVTLLPRLSRVEMAEQFRCSQVAVSPSFHDGTPNTLLEAMACGCLPVAGDIESLREWIIPGVNGLLVDPHDPQALAQAILLALRQGDFRRRAMEFNVRLVAERADYRRVMGQAQDFYRTLINRD